MSTDSVENKIDKILCVECSKPIEIKQHKNKIYCSQYCKKKHHALRYKRLYLEMTNAIAAE